MHDARVLEMCHFILGYAYIFSSTPGIRISNLTNRGITFCFKISSRILYVYSLVISIEEKIVSLDARRVLEGFLKNI